MAAYPALPTLYGTLAENTQKATTFVNGTGGLNTYWPPQKRRFTLKHRLSLAQRDTLNNFFAANQLASDIALTWLDDGLVYTVKFLEKPIIELFQGDANFRTATVLLGEV